MDATHQKSQVPWVLIRNILQDRATEIEAISKSMPCDSATITTPHILSILSGIQWPATISSEILLKLYISFVFHAVSDTEGRHRGPHFDIAYEVLKQHQIAAFDTYERTKNEKTFLLDYLNAYETFLIKFMHLLKVGGEVSLELEDDGQPPLSYFVLAMAGGAKEMFREIMTSEIVYSPPAAPPAALFSKLNIDIEYFFRFY